MRKIIKDETPEFWVKFVRTHPGIHYDQLDNTNEGKSVRQKIREHMVTHQRKICCYCCRSIDLEKSHTEHIKPRHHFPQLSMDYDNLLASCLTKSTCGMRKGDTEDSENFISPLQEDCEEHFRFFPDGRIEGVTNEGKVTIQSLNLNDYALIDARKNQYKACCEMAEYCGKEYILSEYIREHDGKLHRFVDMITYVYRRGDFDPEVVGQL